MEYYGKTLCISYEDLTYDDSPKTVNGKLDYSHSRELNGVPANELPADVLLPIMTAANYKKLKRVGKINVVRAGKGLDNYALIEYNTLPERFKSAIIAKYGEMGEYIRETYYMQFYEVDDKAREFYAQYTFANGDKLPLEKVQEYTTNASVIKTVLKLRQETKSTRKVLQIARTTWNDLQVAITFYKGRYNHTLPTSVKKFQEKANEFVKGGYDTLISKKYGNQNTRKVNYKLERLLLSISAIPTRPFNSLVSDYYNQFMAGEIEVVDYSTGEFFTPDDFLDKKGRPIEVSEKTVANYLNTPTNQILLSNIQDTAYSYSQKVRPHHLRHSPFFSFSKISMDDRDLPRKMQNGRRLKAYYVYDVASGCVIGRSYSMLKDTDLFINCLRDMFRTIQMHSFKMPAEVEVENHLVSQFKDTFMEEGALFNLVRWCKPQNSQEKRAEHLNRAKKYAVEKKNHEGIGRWWAKLAVNRVESAKVYDEENDTYKDKLYDKEQLIVEDMADIREYNNMLHPNQKRYPNLTRWEVLELNLNPNLSDVDPIAVAKAVGYMTETSITRNMYLQVQGEKYMLPTPEVLDRLAPRNNKVQAYYLEDLNNEIKQVYIYQDDKYLCACEKVVRYNEARAEQTEADREAYKVQASYIAKFDAKVKREKISKVKLIDSKVMHNVELMQPQQITVEPRNEEYEEFVGFDIDEYRRRAISSL